MAHEEVELRAGRKKGLRGTHPSPVLRGGKTKEVRRRCTLGLRGRA
jgi:hypothetical protein